MEEDINQSYSHPTNSLLGSELEFGALPNVLDLEKMRAKYVLQHPVYYILVDVSLPIVH